MHAETHAQQVPTLRPTIPIPGRDPASPACHARPGKPGYLEEVQDLVHHVLAREQALQAGPGHALELRIRHGGPAGRRRCPRAAPGGGPWQLPSLGGASHAPACHPAHRRSTRGGCAPSLGELLELQAGVLPVPGAYQGRKQAEWSVVPTAAWLSSWPGTGLTPGCQAESSAAPPLGHLTLWQGSCDMRPPLSPQPELAYSNTLPNTQI